MARRGVASLLEENRQLRVHIKGSESARQRVEGQISELQRRVNGAEAAAAQQLRLKEAEWMTEYDRSVHALLKIIKHHEQEKAQLEKEVQQLRAAAAVVPPPITKMARSTQTEAPKPTRASSRRNSVRFAKEEGDTCITSEKEEIASIDVKMRNKLTRMQRLFEQLQCSKCQQESRSVDELNDPAGDARHVGNIEHPPVRPKHELKAAVLERLQHIKSSSSAVRRQSPVTANLSEESKSIETQTDEGPVPRQQTCSTTIQQGLEERNRLLHERLTSHQKLLDELLYTKLKHASVAVDHALRGCSQSSPCTSSDPVKECIVIDQGDKRIKCDHPLPTTDRVCQDQRSIESTGATERQPMSPVAA